MAKILVVQWHTAIRSLMVLLLRQRGYDVATASDLKAVSASAVQGIDLVCLDLMTPGIDEKEPRSTFDASPLGKQLGAVELLLTDVNGRLENQQESVRRGSVGVFCPRTGRGFPFLVEVERLTPPPPRLPQPILTWRLDKHELPAFLYACFLFGVNGVITLRDKTVYKQLHLIDGWIRSAASSVESDWLGKMLLARHQISAEALNAVERVLGTTKRRIGEEFVARGHLDEKQLTEALTQQYASIAMSVFEWNELEISLEEGSPNPQPHLTVHPFRLLLSGLSYGFTEAEVDAQLGSMDLFPVPTIWTSFRFAEAGLEPEEIRILQAINGQYSIRQLVADAPFSPEATKKFLLALTIMHALLLSPEARDLPVTFERQLQGSSQALIEETFFQEPSIEITFDDLDDAGTPSGSDKTPLWRSQLNYFDLRQGLRYLLLVILGLLLIAVGAQWWLKRQAAEQRLQEAQNAPVQLTKTVVIKKPIYEEADRLLAEAVLVLKSKSWDGENEARSLIGAALNIDPRFDSAMNFRQSLDLAHEARFALDSKDPETAKSILEKAYRLAPENPLLAPLMADAGMKIPSTETPTP